MGSYELGEKGAKMNQEESVVWALKYLIGELKTDLLQAEHVNLGIVPRSGHGDDIWIRTEKIHVVAEVTLCGKGKKWSRIKGPQRQNINKKIKELTSHRGVTHRYLFVADSIASSLKRDGITVVGIPAVA